MILVCVVFAMREDYIRFNPLFQELEAILQFGALIRKIAILQIAKFNFLTMGTPEIRFG